MECRSYRDLRIFNSVFDQRFGGVLADDMGLGKTVQTIAFTTSSEQSTPYLIVGPTNVIYNWEKEIEKFTKRKKKWYK